MAQVTRIGTQVVVRLSGPVCHCRTDELERAYREVCELASTLVAIDLEDAELLDGVGFAFVARLHARWRLRLLNAPVGLRAQLVGAG